ncbi:hypothetical protein E4U31_006463, partial [Claviceps sp. LM219 group G6]
DTFGRAPTTIACWVRVVSTSSALTIDSTVYILSTETLQQNLTQTQADETASAADLKIKECRLPTVILNSNPDLKRGGKCRPEDTAFAFASFRNPIF